MDCVSSPKTVSRMDAGFEPPWMGLRRVFSDDTQFMSRCQCMCLTPLFTTYMNRRHFAETRREPIRGSSASASLRLTVSTRCLRFISQGIICGTVVNGTKLRVLSMIFQQLGDINCCHVNGKGCESGTVGNDHHPQRCGY